MNFIKDQKKVSLKFISNLTKNHFLFFIALVLHTAALPLQISRSKSSPNLSNNQHVLSQDSGDSFVFDRMKAQAERLRLLGSSPVASEGEPGNVPRATGSNAQSCIASSITAMSSAHSDYNHSKAFEKNCELHADKRPLPQKLAQSSLKHAPPIIHAIVNMFKNRANIDKGLLPKKLLLVGDPGTGKTTLGKAIAYECKMPLVKYTASAIADRYKDSGAKNLEKIFHEAAALEQPCIVIIDELEALIKRHDNKNDSEAGMLVTLWTLLDEFEESPIFFIGTLNDAKEAPKQVKNRFSEYIEHVPLPDDVQRKGLLEFYISSYANPSFKEVSIDQLVKLTNGFAHRNLKGLIHVAVKMAYLRDSKANMVVMSDFLNALREIQEKAVYINESYLERTGNKMLKWGPTMTSVAHTGLALVGSGIALAGLFYTIKAQKEGLSLQKQALNTQAKSLDLQEKSFFLQIGGLALGAAGIIVAAIFKK